MLTLYGTELHSHLLLGTAQYPSPAILLDAMRRTKLLKLYLLRRGEKFLERRLKRCDWQMLKDASALIVDQYNRQRAAKLRAQQKPIRIV